MEMGRLGTFLPCWRECQRTGIGVIWVVCVVGRSLLSTVVALESRSRRPPRRPAPQGWRSLEPSGQRSLSHRGGRPMPGRSPIAWLVFHLSAPITEIESIRGDGVPVSVIGHFEVAGGRSPREWLDGSDLYRVSSRMCVA